MILSPVTQSSVDLCNFISIQQVRKAPPHHQGDHYLLPKSPACQKKQILWKKGILKENHFPHGSSNLALGERWWFRFNSHRAAFLPSRLGSPRFYTLSWSTDIFLLSTVVNPADLSKRRASYFLLLTRRNYTFSQWNLRIARFQSVYSRWW